MQAVGGAIATLTAVSGGSSGYCGRCVAAKDPNAKFGPEGDILPGQTISYTITFENEGAGEAFGVFVTDVLGEQLDTSTLAIVGNSLAADYAWSFRTSGRAYLPYFVK